MRVRWCILTPSPWERAGERCLRFVLNGCLGGGETGDRYADYLSAPLSAVPSPRANPCMAPHSTPSAHSAGISVTPRTPHAHMREDLDLSHGGSVAWRIKNMGSLKKKKIKGAFLFSSDHRAREIKSSTLCVRVPAFSLWHSGGLYEAFRAHVA